MIKEDTLRLAVKNAQVPTDFTWHLHSMDVANLDRLLHTYQVGLKRLVGYPIHVDDRYPRWVKMKPELLVHDDCEYIINPSAMAEFGVYMTRKGKPLAARLQEVLVRAQTNHLLPDDFHWYLNSLTFHKLVEANEGVFDAGLVQSHPDDTTYTFLGHRVRNDPDAPKDDAQAILQHSIQCTNDDADWYGMWARRWKCDRKDAKRALLLYTYGPQQYREKRVIKTHYDNLLNGRETLNVTNKFTVDAEVPNVWRDFTGKAKDLQQVANESRRGLRERMPEYVDAVYKAVGEHRYLDAMKHLINLQQQLAIVAGHEEKANRGAR